MDVTRRWWGEAALALVLAGGAVILDEPLLLAGTAGIGAWLVAAQAAFVRRTVTAARSLRVEQSVTPEALVVDGDASVLLTAELARPVPYDVTVTAAPPVAASGSSADERSVTISAGEQAASTTFTVRPQVAGRHEFDAPRVSVSTGLFRSRFASGETTALTAEPRAPRDIHIGAGGEQFAAPFGDYKTGQQGQGLEPAGVREYVIGDSASRIDWNATARRGEPHVVEFETEVELQSALVVDHRASMGDGPEGETKLDYAREVALAYVQSAQRANEPLGLYTVGEHGVTNRHPPNAEPSNYAQIRTLLHDLDPTESETVPDDVTDGRPRATHRSPGDTQSVARRLEAGESAFEASLQPFFAAGSTYVRRLSGDPLFEVLRTELARLRGTVVTVVLTDDTRREETREALRAAQRGDHHAVAFLTPSTLFDDGGLTDLEAAYDRYVDFETFRRTLADRDRVSAYEVGPRDRIEAILAAKRQRGTTK